MTAVLHETSQSLPTLRPARCTDPRPLTAVDVEAALRGMTSIKSPFVQAALAVDFRGDDEDELFGPQQTLAADLPDAMRFASTIATAMFECLNGVRPPAQLSRWFTPTIHALITRRNVVAQRRGARSADRTRVLRVRVCEPESGVAEVSIVAQRADRVFAVAMRMSGADGRWLVTALHLG